MKSTAVTVFLVSSLILGTCCFNTASDAAARDKEQREEKSQKVNKKRKRSDVDKQAKKAGKSKPTAVEIFMHGKLKDSNKILEGLMTEDFDEIADAAQHLTVMSKAAEWFVVEGPTYAQHSAEFRRSAEHLARVAKKKNLDGSALAYLHVTMTCINCHKFVRSTRIARAF